MGDSHHTVCRRDKMHTTLRRGESVWVHGEPAPSVSITHHVTGEVTFYVNPHDRMVTIETIDTEHHDRGSGRKDKEDRG